MPQRLGRIIENPGCTFPEGRVHARFIAASARSVPVVPACCSRLAHRSTTVSTSTRLLPLLLSLTLFGAVVPAAQAEREHDHDRARDAVAAGQVLPLAKVLAQLERDQPGAQVLEVELEEKRGRWVYEIRLLQPGGRLLKQYLDARDGKPLRHGGDGRDGER
jgi:Peptidase propeptide and YPEB domain